jgi:hypothetical protein
LSIQVHNDNMLMFAASTSLKIWKWPDRIAPRYFTPYIDKRF